MILKETQYSSFSTIYVYIQVIHMDMESISTASAGIPLRIPVLLKQIWHFHGKVSGQAALLKIQVDHIMSTDHSPTNAPSSTALQVSLTFVRQSQFAPLVEHTALHQHFLGMQGCSMYADRSLKWNLRDCDEIVQI